MTDRVYPSSKPNGTTIAAAATTGSNCCATTKPPNPTTTTTRRRHRSCLCQRCFWLFIVIILLLLASIVAAISYLIYRPHHPTFSISSLKITQFNLTTTVDDSTYLFAKLNLTLSSKNPNIKLVFFYNPISITTESSSNKIQIANGFFQYFMNNPNNITIIHSTLYISSQVLDVDFASALRMRMRIIHSTLYNSSQVQAIVLECIAGYPCYSENGLVKKQ